MSTAGNLARVMLVLGSFIRAFGMAGTSGAGLNPGGSCWAADGRSTIVIAATAIHRNMVTPRLGIIWSPSRREWRPSNYMSGGGVSAQGAECPIRKVSELSFLFTTGLAEAFPRSVLNK